MNDTPRLQETSIAFQTDKTPAQYRALAELVNCYAFDVVSVYGDAPYQPSYGALTIMAQYLKWARIGPACVSPSRLTPLDMAGHTALLDHLTDGRAYLGIARGAWLEKHGIAELKPPSAAIRECAEIVRRLLAGLESAYEGQIFRMGAGVRLPYPVLRPRVPILIGTWGPKLAAVAGEIADEVKIGGCANPAMIPVMRRWVAEGERRADRPAGACQIVMGAVTVVDEDGRAAKNHVRRDLALYLPVVAALDPTLEVEPDLIARLDALVNSGQKEAAGALIPEELLRKFAFAGTPADVLEQAQALYDAGANRVEFGTPHGIDAYQGIRLLGEKVLPYLTLRR